MITLTSNKLFHDLKRQVEADITRLGFPCQLHDINELNNRYRLARSFEGILLKEYSDEIRAGYDAFFQVFLAHSTLELFMPVVGLDVRKLDLLLPLLQPYQPEVMASDFVAADVEQRLCEFLVNSLDNKKLGEHLLAIYRGEEHNPVHISAAIRHIFAHGHLTASANKINPVKMKKICSRLSTYLLDFIDAEFTIRVGQGQDNLNRSQIQ